MTSFCENVEGNRGFSLIAPSGLHVVLSPNLHFLVPPPGL